MLKIYNTATRTKQEFNKKTGEEVTMYNCGLTVYDYPHIGNLRAYTMADIIRRSLEFLGYKVTQVQNFTDVGHMTLTDEQKASLKEQRDVTDDETGIDRMEKASKKLGKSAKEVAEFFIAEAMKDFAKMNFEEPFARPKATDYIEEQKDLIKILLDKNFAYITQSAIYFDTSKFPNYGSLSGQKLDEKKVGVRDEVEVDPNKKNPYDFRLWQLDQPNHAQHWTLNYKGNDYQGFPGWHVECSAMIHAILGEPIDIHTGGVDHISVHHTNEIAQTEAAFDHPLANFWIHNEFLLVDGRKMSKSLGNFYTLKDIGEKGFDPMDLRYFYLTANFTTQQNLTWEGLEAARSARLKLVKIASELSNLESNFDESVSKLKDSFLQSFTESIEDSFNTPKAIANIWNMLSENNLSNSNKKELLIKFDEVLGLNLFFEQNLDIKVDVKISDELKKQLEEIIAKRSKSKANKDFKTADQLREDAKNLGFELEDTKDGTIWKKL